MFILGILCTLLLIGWTDIARGDFRALFVFCFALVFGVIGYLDDYEKVKKKENTGLTAGPKFLLQLAAAIAFTVLLRHYGYLAPHLYLPFVDVYKRQVVGFLAVGVFAALVLMSYVRLTVVSDQVVSLRSELDSLKTEESKLMARYDLAFDLSAIEAQVTADGSMTKPQSGHCLLYTSRCV